MHNNHTPREQVAVNWIRKFVTAVDSYAGEIIKTYIIK